MDRTIVYPGAIPQDTDILQPQRNVMVALGFLMQAAFGTSTLADGLACTQTSVASMSVLIGPGSLMTLSTVDATAYGSLGSDTTDALMKQGINVSSQTIGPFTAPGTAGQSQNFLIEATFSEVDTNSTVLPYYNSSAPSSPYLGPGNTGSAQSTKRQQSVAIAIKAGTAATTGSQTTPAPDSGYVGLWVITIANGASSITNSNISLYSGAPFIGSKIPAIDSAIAGLGVGYGETIFTTSGTLTVPAGVTTIWVSGCAGGAGGNQYVSGGAGQPVIETPITVTAGHVLTATIGAAGAGGTTSCTGGGNTTLVDTTASTTLLTLTGGAGASGGSAQSVGYPSGALPTANYPTQGASGPFGGGGPSGGSTSGGAGGAAYGYGAGGGQGFAATGGNGAPGFLILRW